MMDLKKYDINLEDIIKGIKDNDNIGLVMGSIYTKAHGWTQLIVRMNKDGVFVPTEIFTDKEIKFVEERFKQLNLRFRRVE